MPSKKTLLLSSAALIALVGALRVTAGHIPLLAHLGKQPDGSFVVSSGQHIAPGTIAFDFRPDRPRAASVRPVLCRAKPVERVSGDTRRRDSRSNVPLGSGAAYRGARWSPDGTRLYVSVENGWVQELLLEDRKLSAGQKIDDCACGSQRQSATGRNVHHAGRNPAVRRPPATATPSRK